MVIVDEAYNEREMETAVPKTVRPVNGRCDPPFYPAFRTLHAECPYKSSV